MEALLVSTSLVALAEVGDKTQLLSLLQAARFSKPWPIVPDFEALQQQEAAATVSHTAEGKP